MTGSFGGADGSELASCGTVPAMQAQYKKVIDPFGLTRIDLGIEADLYTCNGTGAQRWTRDGDTLRALGTCLHVAAAGTANGTKVQALPAPHRRWTLTA
ncbi:hypothetical protein GTY54_38645 [Streptomyces sp. SID625]|nr:hypothetical protein [Streptomyces sp. SID625]